jgi:integrase
VRGASDGKSKPSGRTHREDANHKIIIRSLPVMEWPEADSDSWSSACRPGSRLKAGGAASHLAAVTRNDLARRYGYFMDFLKRAGRLDRRAAAGAHVTWENVQPYIAELQARVSSATVHGSITKVRRAAELMVPDGNFAWLAEIEKDLALIMEPASKFDRLVLTEVLVEAGLTLIAESELSCETELARARMVRNGLMVALLALCPIRLKNFAALEIGRTFVEINSSWWIILPKHETKSRRPDERRVPDILNPAIDAYLERHRPVLARSERPPTALWLSANDGAQMSYNGVEHAISETTRSSIGVDVSPHLFRTAAASTGAVYGGNMPHLATALLNHTDPRVTEEHYNRASSVSAGKIYAEIINSHLQE